MTQDDLTHLESRLQIVLPDFYKQFVLSYPQELIDAAWSVDLGGGNMFSEGPAELELLNSPKWLLNLNEPPLGRKPNNWSENLFVIGNNGDGEAYGIDITAESSAVYHGNPFTKSSGEPKVIANSLKEFATQLLSHYRSRQ